MPGDLVRRQKIASNSIRNQAAAASEEHGDRPRKDSGPRIANSASVSREIERWSMSFLNVSLSRTPAPYSVRAARGHYFVRFHRLELVASGVRTYLNDSKSPGGLIQCRSHHLPHLTRMSANLAGSKDTRYLMSDLKDGYAVSACL